MHPVYNALCISIVYLTLAGQNSESKVMYSNIMCQIPTKFKYVFYRAIFVEKLIYLPCEDEVVMRGTINYSIIAPCMRNKSVTFYGEKKGVGTKGYCARTESGNIRVVTSSNKTALFLITREGKNETETFTCTVDAKIVDGYTVLLKFGPQYGLSLGRLFIRPPANETNKCRTRFQRSSEVKITNCGFYIYLLLISALLLMSGTISISDL
ncbi:hypothetical protein BgiMline_027298 [Biomphalaria glabrata]|uniref:Uncharacterized protein LOC106079875 isoform X1 n=1 Tax=Biomphalaria glabrata TaxID=6526 RepID=A0A2C9K3I3_BIOGL|nr:uncharacterized protein LOC106079875 isoform X1 [Biomphalaria glabrata]KAI8735942.1 hypothetical protein BgiBS90_036476 [Biomphalaria glabrata]KAI8738197.1 hypothetical protein BgiMline_025100 [Biomphalaria glabrata]